MLAISIHAPVKGATRGAPLTRRTRWHFNPRSREGSDKNALYPPKIMVISIHAPVKGATCTAVVMLHARNAISIHAPVKGATRLPASGAVWSTISIHAPVKGATGCGVRITQNGVISIHAPVKGATGTSTCTLRLQNFNPRSREGSDDNAARNASRTRHFNPRSREGSDSTWLSMMGVSCAFQSTLP